MTPALLGRLRAATGSDRELDAEIARACGWTELVGTGLDRRGTQGKPPGRIGWAWVPAYTGSLDAAASLVPPNTGWIVRADPAGASARTWPHGAEAPDAELERGATPALALCIAALHARGIG